MVFFFVFDGYGNCCVLVVVGDVDFVVIGVSY